MLMTRRNVHALFLSTLISEAYGPHASAYDNLRATNADVAPAAVSNPNFSLQPLTTNANVPVTQSYFVLSSQPGEVHTCTVRVSNVGDSTGNAHLFAVDATTAQTSGVVYNNETDPRNDVSTWTAINGTTITLDAGASQDVSFTIAVPTTVRAGQHVGAIVATGTPPITGGQVTIVSRVAVPIVVNLPPPLTERFMIPSLALGGTEASPGMLVGLRNDGTVLQKPTVNIVVRDAAGHSALTVSTLALNTFVPQTQINYPVAIVPGTLPTGDYSVTVTVTYGTSGQATATLPLAYYYVPTLIAIGPESGETTGGSVVTLAGFGFGTTTDTQVFMDGVVVPSASIQNITARSIRFIAPAHPSGRVAITVKIGGVLVSGSMSYQYNVVTARPPAPHPVAPTQGPVHTGPVMPHPTVTPPPSGTPPPNAQPTRH